MAKIKRNNKGTWVCDLWTLILNFKNSCSDPQFPRSIDYWEGLSFFKAWKTENRLIKNVNCCGQLNATVFTCPSEPSQVPRSLGSHSCQSGKQTRVNPPPQTSSSSFWKIGILFMHSDIKVELCSKWRRNLREEVFTWWSSCTTDFYGKTSRHNTVQLLHCTMLHFLYFCFNLNFTKAKEADKYDTWKLNWLGGQQQGGGRFLCDQRWEHQTLGSFLSAWHPTCMRSTQPKKPESLHR